jgi:hypothetical protein
MKRVIGLLVILLALGLTACEGGSTTTTSTPRSNIDIHSLEIGDTVSFTGQKASANLVNGNTVWVQVQQTDGTFVIYHCQLKDAYFDKSDSITIGSVMKIKGLFLSLMDLELENTSPLVTLYDCEIVK